MRGVAGTTLDSLLQGDSVCHSAHWVFSLQFFELDGGVLVQELVDGQESTAHSDLDFVFYAFDHDAFGAELINALRFAHEHNFQFLTVRVVIDVFSQLFVNSITLLRNVDCDA